MKTLSEVIKALEKCMTDDAIESEGVYLAKDSLYYLKEYQTTQMAYIKAMADLKDNPPITWDELRTMEGKPVYVKLLGAYESYPNASRWMLVQSDVSFGNVWFIDRSRARYCFYEKDMNDIWQAY